MKIRIGILIFFLALSARILYLEQIKDTLLFYFPIVDSGAFNYESARLAESGIAAKDILYSHRMPFYQLFLSAIYRIGGHNVYISRFVQSVLGAYGCFLVYLLGQTAFNRKVGILGGVTTSLYWPLIAFEAKFLPVNLAIFSSLLAVFCVYKFLDVKKLFWICLSAVFLASAVLTMSNIFLFFPVLCLWLFITARGKSGFSRSALYAIVFVISFSIVIAPYIFKFYQMRKEIMPIQDNYGVGIYFGADLEHIRIRPGSSLRKLMMELLDKDLTRIKERNLYFLTKTKELILRNPANYLDNLHKKIYILWNSSEFSPRENINDFRAQSKFLSLPLFNFGTIGALSILGMILAWRNFRVRAMPLYLFVFSYEASIILFMPLSRYRLPVAPFLAIFASFCAVSFFEDLHNRRYNPVLQFLTFFIPLFLLTNTNALKIYLDGFSRPYYHEGLAYWKNTDDDKKALLMFRKELVRNPDDADVYEAMGNIYLGKDDLKRAEICYKKALSLESRFPEVMNNLGIVYAKRGETKKAKDIFEKVLSSFPVESVKAHINLGSLYMLEGDLKAAEKEYERALFLDPKNMQAIYRLASLYDKTGDGRAKSLWEKYREAETTLFDRVGRPKVDLRGL